MMAGCLGTSAEGRGEAPGVRIGMGIGWGCDRNLKEKHAKRCGTPMETIENPSDGFQTMIYMFGGFSRSIQAFTVGGYPNN